MNKVQYDIYQCRCDVLSDWDLGEGKCMESVFSLDDATKAVADYQTGGHAAWFIEILMEG